MHHECGAPGTSTLGRVTVGYAEKRGKGRNTYYRARYKKLDGSYGTLPDKYTKSKDATDAADREEVRIRIREIPYADPREGKKTFGAWAREWMAAKQKRPRTVEKRWFHLDKLLLPQWEHTPIADITWFDVESWADKSDYDRDTVRHAITLMSSILTSAVDKRLIGHNPVAGRRWKPATRPAGSPVNRRGKKTGGKHKVVPTAEQAILIANRCRNETERLMVICATWLGLRYGELGALHRDNCLVERVDRIGGTEVTRYVVIVDEEKGELLEYTVRGDDGSKTSVLEVGEPKSEGSVREVDVPPFLVELLRAYMEKWPHPYLFTTPSGTWWWRSNWSEVWLPVCAGRPAKPKPGWRQCADDLQLRITQSEVLPGDRLPSLKEIAAEFGVAVGTAQRAVAYLRDRGVVTVLRGRGSGIVVAEDAAARASVPEDDGALEPILPGLGLHGCRHANDTRLEQCGVPDVMRRESLGHARDRGMDGVYLHATPEMRQHRLAVLEQWWWEGQAAVGGVVAEPPSPKKWRNMIVSQNSPSGAKSIKFGGAIPGQSDAPVNRIPV